MELTKSDFNIIRDYIRGACGIDLGDDKEYLVQQRLESVAKSQGCVNFREFAILMRACPDPAVHDQVVAAITTNETSFFRDTHPYEMFRSLLLPQLAQVARERKNRPISRKGAKISILSAGASTGQEPYSLSILIHDVLQSRPDLGLAPEDFSIVATDISTRVLAKAIAGEYTEMEVNRGLTDMQKMMYFTREGDAWIIKDAFKRMIEFRSVNLIQPFLHLGGFDMIFCRNVLIYFDIATRRKIFDQFYRLLPENGVMILGSTENIYGVSDLFDSHHEKESVYYTKKSAAPESIAKAIPVQTNFSLSK